MIQLTRLNKHVFLVNPELIKFVEANPDTVITLTNGEKIVVLESPSIVAELIFQYRVELAQSLSTRGIWRASTQSSAAASNGPAEES